MTDTDSEMRAKQIRAAAKEHAQTVRAATSPPPPQRTLITRPGTPVPQAAPPSATVTAAVPTVPTSDGFSLVVGPALVSLSGIVGPIVKFIKGSYYLDRGATTVPLGTEMIARDVAEKQTLFKNGRVAEEHVRKPGVPFPPREELGYLDPSAWPPGPDGKPSDPWVHQMYILLFDPNTVLDCTFITGTSGGHKAVRQLARQVAYRREILGRSDILARIKLDVSKYNHRQYGLVLEPSFPIVGYAGHDLRPLPDIPLADELNDSISY